MSQKWRIVTTYPVRNVVTVEIDGKQYSTFDTVQEAIAVKELLAEAYYVFDFIIVGEQTGEQILKLPRS